MVSVIIPVRNQEKLITRCLESIPLRSDIQIVIVNDKSDDGTEDAIWWWWGHIRRTESRPKFLLIENDERMYCSGSMNRGIEHSEGEYIMQLDSDDYLNTEAFNRLLDLKREEDIIFFNLQVNNGSVWKPTEMDGLCDHICLYKREIIGETRQEQIKSGAGFRFHREIMSKPHSKYHFDEVVYYYDFPREGSNLDLYHKGLL